MAYDFGDINVYLALAGKEQFTTYMFVDIMLEKPIYMTSYPSELNMLDAVGGNAVYEPYLLESITPPPRTGSITQEVQRFTVAQGLGAYFADAPADFVRILGEDFHNTQIYFRAIITTDGTTLVDNAPIMRSEGMLKGITRSVKNNNVIVEFSNSFGKLNMLQELRTTPGSVKRRNADDTCFDRAHVDVSKRILDWGIRTKLNKKK